ncbi:TPA: efflux RND transporter periplasmic adaptor subunit [Citrobacter freundii]
MKYRHSLTFIAIAVIAATAGYWLGANHAKPGNGATPPASSASTGRKVLYWYDPMNPGTRFDKPGKSPFMDMDLVPRYSDDKPESNGVKIDSRQQQNLGVRTAKVIRQSLGTQFSAFGTVATDERSVETIPAPANGLVEKLFVNATQQFVKKDESLAQIWIPSWTAAQQEYLAVRTLHDAALTAAARARLQLQFMPDEVIRRVEQTGKPQTHITLRAPHDGYVSKLNIRAGAQVTATQALFELASLDPVWIVIDYPESQTRLLTPGSKVEATTDSWPGTVFHGSVSELLPDLDPVLRTLKARVLLDNQQHQLKPGMYLNVHLAQSAPEAPVLTIPEEALIVTGAESKVLVTDGDGYFHPVNVTAGRTQKGRVEILSGLQEGQQVVTSGQFLIDSEASLRSALPQMGDAPKAIPTYSTNGIIKALNADSVTISHQPVPALKWSAMTMDFAITAQQKQQLKPGDNVMFSFSLDDAGPKITAIMPMNGSKEQP